MDRKIEVRFRDRTTPPHIVTLVLLAGISALAMNIFVPSLPMMSAYFDTDYQVMQLAVAGYLAANAVLQIFIGPISDHYGRRPVILAGIGLFCLATVGCLLAPDSFTFLLFRMLQAVVATAMVLSRAVVRDMYPQDQAASMIGYVTMGMSVVPMIGPVIGGYLGEQFGWQANFWVLLIVGLLILWISYDDVGETKQRSGQTIGQQVREYPELLGSPRFWGYAMASALSSGAFFSYVGGAPFIGTELYGMSASELGFFFGAPAVGYFFGNYITGRFAARIGVNRMVLWGSLIVAIPMVALMGFFAAGLDSKWVFFGFMTFVGIGNGMTIPNATAGMLSVRPQLAGTASGLGGAIMLGGGAAMSALAGLLLSVETGAWPLLYLMAGTALASLTAILLVIWREKQLRGLDTA
ncbi:multidrug effflux MFS transporter [Tropicibacter sp. R15_0]|uniref:multidrug effflux MFS transporter n=1 Tax=Tropicibacter sp. R15_0 TaxID=2821101 RepID=UPI001ADC60AF|nr:multidrug effflux MFS transporter [Tropicibacter sp. R15_0]MBO9466172.1 multidrug effflux MFS transporter [Tropicibacter sp. R15_0]